jgi:hypothetical protein
MVITDWAAQDRRLRNAETLGKFIPQLFRPQRPRAQTLSVATIGLLRVSAAYLGLREAQS